MTNGSTSPKAKPKKVLIVEDETLTAMMLEEYILEKGFLSAGLSATGEDAISKARSEVPDLVFMDYRLGGRMNGMEAAGIINAELQIPIILMSGYSEHIVLEKAGEFRPRFILQKPLEDTDIDKVLAVIA